MAYDFSAYVCWRRIIIVCCNHGYAATNTEIKPSRLKMEIPVAVYYSSKLAVIKNIDVSIIYHLCLYAFEI